MQLNCGSHECAGGSPHPEVDMRQTHVVDAQCCYRLYYSILVVAALKLKA